MDTLIKTGELAPDFQITDIAGNLFSLGELEGWIRVLNFWSAECTWCERVDHELILHLDAWKDQVKVIWIASNANEGPQLIARVAADRQIPAMLVDQDQKVANLYGAQVTPHFFIVNANGILVYQGAWDDITFRKRVATQVYVPQVVQALRHGQSPGISQTPPYGCVLVRFMELST